MQLTDSVLALHGVGTAQRDKLRRLGVETLQGLLTLLPRRWDDFSNPMPIAFARFGETVIVRGKLSDITLERTKRRFMAVVRATLTDESGSIGLKWFNQAFLLNALKRLEEVTVQGKVARDRAQGRVLHVQQLEQVGAIYPVYPETAGITSKMLRRWIAQALPLLPALPDPLPSHIRIAQRLLSLPDTYRILHDPLSQDELQRAKERIAFDELLRIALNVVTQQQAIASSEGIPITVAMVQIRAFVKKLPFDLTGDQRRAAWQILQDFGRSTPMNRLLNGEVGSGKTVVGAIAITAAAQAHLQTVWLAPTEILAQQHATTLAQFFTSFGIDVGLLTAHHLEINHIAASKEEVTQAPVVVGTHALLSAGVRFPNIGLVIVDEQHRFGVEQRAQLRGNRTGRTVPHLLSMTATPIPRSLALALYGDLELSTIREKPAERQTVTTRLYTAEEREKAYALIRAEVAAAHRAYVICPLVEESADSERLFDYDSKKAVKAEYERLRTDVFADLQLGMVYGGMAAKEKTAQMAAFRKGTTQILVATSVVEVGVDVPEATVILIEGAERFGLAQLHQLRGRVGRSQYRAHCIALAEYPTPKAQERLQVFVSTTDGFVLAQKDLELRGPGEMYGTAQSGLPDLKMASLGDAELIKRTRAVAQQIVEEGVERYPQLATLLQGREQAYLE